MTNDITLADWKCLYLECMLKATNSIRNDLSSYTISCFT